MAYAVQLNRTAQKQLADVSHNRALQRRLEAAIDGLAQEPRPPSSISVVGEDSMRRVRVGDYRILYWILDHQSVVVIASIRHRRDVYRKL